MAARLSAAALETLAIVAYRQPITRAEVEHIRGVEAGPVLRSLLERQLVRIAGHREVPGRPILYATTRRFLEVFGLGKLGDLPALRDLAELDFDEESGAVVTLTPEEAAARAEAGEGEDAADTPPTKHPQDGNRSGCPTTGFSMLEAVSDSPGCADFGMRSGGRATRGSALPRCGRPVH